jgi:hypothetical protein
VAVGSRLGNDLGADDGAATRLVVDDHLLAEQDRQSLGDDPRAEVSVEPPGA